MKARIWIVAAALLTVPLLFAQDTLYNNGPDPGNIYGLPISNDYEVANSFTLATPSTVVAINVSLYDVNVYNLPLALDWKKFDKPHGHLLAYGSQSQLRWVSGPFSNYFLLNQWLMQFDVSPRLSLPRGSYWLVLSNAMNTWNTPTWWGECNGPSEVAFSSNGFIQYEWKHGGHYENGSESFQILGYSADVDYQQRSR
jgi:hypothetical protein